MKLERNPEIGDIFVGQIADITTSIVVTDVDEYDLKFIKRIELDNINPIEYQGSLVWFKSKNFDFVGICKIKKINLYLQTDVVLF